MKYFETKFTITPLSQDASDLLAALLGEAGFESFVETAEGLTGYIQQQLFDQQALDDVIASFPMTDVHLIYNIAEADDRDWNAQWEQEGFEPIVIKSEKSEVNSDAPTLIVHDGRHLPSDETLSPIATPLYIEIDAQMAFGTGTHETTQLMCGMLLELPLQGASVLDAGCGTGILGIAALKLGASSVTAYDIDEWSSDNTRHNAIINGVDERITIHCGDATVLDSIAERFDVVVANINRNILLADMPRFVQVMAPGGTLLLSGFYTADIPLLEEKATELGLAILNKRERGGWALISLQRTV